MRIVEITMDFVFIRRICSLFTLNSFMEISFTKIPIGRLRQPFEHDKRYYYFFWLQWPIMKTLSPCK